MLCFILMYFFGHGIQFSRLYNVGKMRVNLILGLSAPYQMSNPEESKQNKRSSTLPRFCGSETRQDILHFLMFLRSWRLYQPTLLSPPQTRLLNPSFNHAKEKGKCGSREPCTITSLRSPVVRLRPDPWPLDAVEPLEEELPVVEQLLDTWLRERKLGLL